MAVNITESTSLASQRNLSQVQQKLQRSLERLSSGMRINRGADDSAGLAISEGLSASIRSMTQAMQNANNGISLVQTAEGGLRETSDILGRMRELATQAANGTLNSADRSAINTEFKQLGQELDRIANTTEFNGTKLLDGSLATPDKAVTLQVGTSAAPEGNQISVQAESVAASSLGIDLISLDTQDGAMNALGAIDNALQTVSGQQSQLGSAQNRLTSAINTLQTGQENASAANARIRDVDVAMEAANMLTSKMLTQAGTAIQAQANQAPLAALKLLL